MKQFNLIKVSDLSELEIGDLIWHDPTNSLSEVIMTNTEQELIDKEISCLLFNNGCSVYRII